MSVLVRDIEKFVRTRFAYSVEEDEYAKHRYLMQNFKSRVDQLASQITSNYLQIKYSLTSSGKVIKHINPERVTVLRRKLKKLAIKVQNGDIPYENVENAFKGWMGSFYKLLSKQQRVNLITLYE